MTIEVRKLTNDAGRCLYCLVAARYESPMLQRLLADADALIDDGQILKHDRTTTVALVEDESQRWVVKRYNNKDRWHAIRRTIQRSRARRCWWAAWKMRRADIDTPPPVAMIEERFGPLRGRAYFVAEYVDGILLPDFVRQPANLDIATTAMARLFRSLYEQRIKHGDMKDTNLLMCGARVYALDLDAACGQWPTTWMRRTYRRERARFLDNYVGLPEVRAHFDAAIPTVDQL